MRTGAATTPSAGRKRAGRAVPLIPRRALFGDPQRHSPRLSPDGAWLAFIAPHQGSANIWLAPADDIGAARPLTRERGHGVRSCRWAWDSARLCYLKDRDGDENCHLFVLPLDAGAAVDLTPLDGVAARVLAGSPFRPTELLITLNDRDRRWHDVYRVDLVSGARQLVLRHDRFIGFLADRRLTLRLAVTPNGEGGLDHMVPQGDGGWRLLFRVAAEDTLATGLAGFGPDDGTRAYLIDSRGRDRAAAAAIDLVSGATTELAADPAAEIVEVLIDPVERGVQAVRASALRSRWIVTDSRVAADFARLAALARGDFHILSRTADDRRWIVLHAGDTEPGVYHLYDRVTGAAWPLFAARPDLRGARLRPMQAITVPARDGLALPAYLTRPAGARGEAPGALVLLVHGGPWTRDSWGFNPWHQWLADRGYAALSVNFRGSTGFGKAFTNAGDGEWGGRMQDDLLDAAAWAVRSGVAAPQHIAIMGASYGGYATLAALAFTPEAFACGIDVFGPGDLEALLANIPPYWQPLSALWRRVGDLASAEGRRRLHDRSPLHRAGEIRRSLLVAHGRNDPRVSESASQAIVAAMQRNHRPVVFLRYPDEGHGLVRQENRLAFHAVAEAFLARCLGGRCEAFGRDLEHAGMQIETGAELIGGLAAVGQKGGGT